MNLRLQGNLNKPICDKLLGKLDNGSDAYAPENLEASKLVFTVTDITDIVSK